MKHGTLKQWLPIVLAGVCSAHLTVTAQVAVLVTNTLPVTGSDVVGSHVTFRAAFSSATPLTYQWRKDTGAGPVNLPGATNSTLTLGPLQLSDSATPGYSLRASNASGVAYSSARAFTVNPAPAPTNNVVMAAANQTGPGSGWFVPTWTIAPGSLISGLSPSSVGSGSFSLEGGGGVAVLTDGVFGALSNSVSGNHPGSATCGNSAGTSLTYTLPATAPGYTVTNLVVYGGWNDSGRDQQNYTVSYTTAAAPNTFRPLATVNYNPTIASAVQSATRVSLTPATTATLATNVVKVKFDFGPVENGYCGYSEIAVFGAPAGPPPVVGLPTCSPANRVDAGTVVTLGAVASGVPPLRYQWQTDGGSGGANYADIPGATNADFDLETARFGSFMLNYRVMVTDLYGSATSPALLLTVTRTNATVSAATVGKLRCEYLPNPLGIDARQPRLSWIVTAERRGERQTAYQVLVASSCRLLDQDIGDLWNSGTIVSDDSAQIVYAGSPLTSRQSCFWKVRVWDRDGNPSAWSPMGQWHMGLLNPTDWSAQWVTTETPPLPPSPTTLVISSAIYEAVDGAGSADVTAVLAGLVSGNRLRVTVDNTSLGTDPAYGHVKRLRVDYLLGGQAFSNVVNENQTLTIPEEPSALRYVRKSFDLPAPVQRAVLYATALGLYEAQINGQRVGEHVLAPDWTDYRKRVRYQAYDVTALVRQGSNTLAALLADGWFSGHIGNGGYQFYGRGPAFLAQLEVTYAGGQTERLVTDASWKTHPSPILASDFMLGEDYDARLEVAGWSQPGLDEGAWVAAVVTNDTTRLLEAQVMEPVRQLAEISPKSVTEPAPGCWTYDLGQNMVGVVRLKVSAPAGTKVTLRHAEMLNPDGTLYTQNLRGAPSVDHYICKGGGVEIWQPRFTFHGFRYVELTGLPTPPVADAVTGIVIGSDTPRAGEFTCSDARLNQLQSNIQWGQRGNYLSVPTDCPQRDERLGWMGDAQVFIRTATYNADVAAFFTKWMVDVDDGQSAAGSYGDVSPNTGGGGAPAWGDAGVICPWTIYQAYGDRRILENHLPAMTRWVEYLRARSTGLIRDHDRGSDYGDWLAIAADTSRELIGTAYFAYATRLVAQSYAALGRAAEAASYEQLFQDIKTAFIARYVAADGRISGNTQCGYLMALKFDLLPDGLRAKAAEYLEADIKDRGDHLSTGFVGVSYLLPVLAQAGKTDIAYRLLLQDTFPSWLFSVKHGATTIWERWDGWTPEHGFQDPGMNSFNHYSLGSCGEYLFGGVAGIQPGSPGFKTVRIRPDLSGRLTWARASYESIRGPIASEWTLTNNQATLDVTIPPGALATVALPTFGMGVSNLVVKESGVAIWQNGVVAARVPEVEFQTIEETGTETRVVWNVGSGAYQFSWNILLPPSGLKASAGNGRVDLNWNPSPDATRYSLKRSLSAGGPYTPLASVAGTRFADLPVTNGVAYYYVVSATVAGGESSDSAEVNAVPGRLPGFDFETPYVGNYQYNPSGAFWSFGGAAGSGSGLLANGSGFGNPNAPEGVQAAFLQAYGSLAQTLSGFAPGTHYTLTFSAAQRSGANQHGGESWDVKLDDHVIASYNPGPAATSYVDYSATFAATATTHTLSFVGTDLATGDNTVFLDNVRIVPPLQPAVTGPAPVIQATRLASDQLSLRGTGPAARPCVLLCASHLSLPAIWTPCRTNVSDAEGGFAFTNLPITDERQFFRLEVY